MTRVLFRDPSKFFSNAGLCLLNFLAGAFVALPGAAVVAYFDTGGGQCMGGGMGAALLLIYLVFPAYIVIYVIATAFLLTRVANITNAMLGGAAWGLEQRQVL